MYINIANKLCKFNYIFLSNICHAACIQSYLFSSKNSLNPECEHEKKIMIFYSLLFSILDILHEICFLSASDGASF